MTENVGVGIDVDEEGLFHVRCSGGTGSNGHRRGARATWPGCRKGVVIDHRRDDPTGVLAKMTQNNSTHCIPVADSAATGTQPLIADEPGSNSFVSVFIQIK